MSRTATLIRNMLGVYYRLDTGRISGRNDTFKTLDWNWRRLHAALEEGGYEELDSNPALAERYARLERRYLLGRASAAR